jgi:hypothetical protein
MPPIPTHSRPLETDGAGAMVSLVGPVRSCLLVGAGKVDVFAEVNNGKVVGVSAAGMEVKKVKSRQKLAETSPGLILASMQLAQTDVYYYGYWVYDPVADYYYWFTADVVIVDASWVDYVP